MLRCICSDDWILSYDVGKTYIEGKALPHSPECDKEFVKNIQESRDLSLLRRWKWITASEKCDHPYSHGPHGRCSGRSFDRT